MSREPTALDRICELAADHATGELICAAASLEVHVYLQRGRIAWATDAARPLEFTRRLLHIAQIEVEAFREILESCRREKRPLGETLIAWGVATKEEVRDALRHQIESALTSLATCPATDSLFLKRSAQYADYDADLTFSTDELTTRPARVVPSGRPAVAVVRSEAPPPSAAFLQLRASFDGLVWAAELDGTTIVQGFPGDVTTQLSLDLVARTVLDGASLVTLQASKKTLAGVALGEGRSLFCLVDASVTIGSVTATLAAMVVEPPVRQLAIATHRETERADERLTSGTGDARASAVLTEFLERAPDVHGVFVTAEEQPTAPFGVARGTRIGREVADLVARRASALATGAGPRDSSVPHDADVEGVTPYRAMTTEADCSLFAVEIVIDGAPLLAWLALDRSGSKGLGWGYLTSLGRTLARALRGEAK